MFSEYFKTGFGQNELILLKNQLESQGFEITDLTESNPTKCGFDYSPLDADSLFRSDDNLLYIPEPKGSVSVRRSIASYYNGRYTAPSGKINSDNIFLTSGTSESYSHLFKILCNPGDEILIPKPGYPLFELLAGINYLNYGYYRLIYEDRWEIDFDSLQNSLSEKTKALIIVNPNNPTGNYLSATELRKISDICSKHNISLICDEVFYDYNLIPLAKNADFVNADFDFPVFVLNGLSKICAVPQFKLGWILANSPEICAEQIKNNLEIVCDTYLSVNSIIQNSFNGVFGFRKFIQKQIKTRIMNNLIQLRFLKPYCVEGGWNAIVDLPDEYDEEKFTEKLLKNGIFVHPGYFYDFENGNKIVLSLIVPEDIFLKGLNGIKNFLK